MSNLCGMFVARACPSHVACLSLGGLLSKKTLMPKACVDVWAERFSENRWCSFDYGEELVDREWTRAC